MYSGWQSEASLPRKVDAHQTDRLLFVTAVLVCTPRRMSPLLGVDSPCMGEKMVAEERTRGVIFLYLPLCYYVALTVWSNHDAHIYCK